MKTVIENAFGEPVDALFDDFDPKPIAAASIGQVYRAHFEGRPVAVKVQYPGIRDTMDDDFGRLEALSRMASLATAVDGRAIVRELQSRIHEECDYLREAAHQSAFAAAFADDADVAIPEVVYERTRDMVLTTAWSPGSDFYGFVGGASGDRRDEVGQVLARFAFRSLYGLGSLNADPHPGNYLFPDDGRVVFLDFGCVRHFDAEFLAAQRHLTEVVIDDRRPEFDDALLAAGMVAKPDRFDFDHHWALMCHELSPYRSARFRFTTEYVRRGMEFSRPGNPNLRLLAIPPQWIWLERLTWGLHAVLARLDAEGPFADVMREALSQPMQRLEVG
jgi:predicted unusual protein kinase regulating ubiquinone biosynthesis (AarF/ABC1/UbiB family)